MTASSFGLLFILSDSGVRLRSITSPDDTFSFSKQSLTRSNAHCERHVYPRCKCARECALMSQEMSLTSCTCGARILVSFFLLFILCAWCSKGFIIVIRALWIYLFYDDDVDDDDDDDDDDIDDVEQLEE